MPSPELLGEILGFLNRSKFSAITFLPILFFHFHIKRPGAAAALSVAAKQHGVTSLVQLIFLILMGFLKQVKLHAYLGIFSDSD